VAAALEVVTGLQDAMIGIMQRGQDLGYEGRLAAISAVARVSFDIPTMARLSYGPGFDALTPEQRRRWLDVYGRFHLSSLADVRDRYSGQTYRILGYDEPAPGVVLIRSKLDYPGRAVDLYTDYRLRRTTDGWRIVDVHDPPSVSEVAMRRAEYRTVLERYGFDGLIAEMESRIERRARR
jgi:ABC-type transporter MlaC component